MIDITQYLLNLLGFSFFIFSSLLEKSQFQKELIEIKTMDIDFKHRSLAELKNQAAFLSNQAFDLAFEIWQYPQKRKEIEAEALLQKRHLMELWNELSKQISPKDLATEDCIKQIHEGLFDLQFVLRAEQSALSHRLYQRIYPKGLQKGVPRAQSTDE